MVGDCGGGGGEEEEWIWRKIRRRAGCLVFYMCEEGRPGRGRGGDATLRGRHETVQTRRTWQLWLLRGEEDGWGKGVFETEMIGRLACFKRGSFPPARSPCASICAGGSSEILQHSGGRCHTLDWTDGCSCPLATFLRNGAWEQPKAARVAPSCLTPSPFGLLTYPPISSSGYSKGTAGGFAKAANRAVSGIHWESIIVSLGEDMQLSQHLCGSMSVWASHLAQGGRLPA